MSQEEQKQKKVIWTNNQLVKLKTIQYDCTWLCFVYYRQGYPRFSISQVVDGLSTTAITLAMTPVMLSYTMDTITEVADSKDSDIKRTIIANNNIFVEGTRTNELQVSGEITIFKDKASGAIMLKFTFLHADTDARVQRLRVPLKDNSVSFTFPIVNDEYFKLDDVGSKEMFAKSYAKLLNEVNFTYLSLYTDKYLSTEQPK